MGMKLSVSLAEDDVEFIDSYVARTEVSTRSAAVRHAIDLLRASELEDVYAQAWDEWSDGGDGPAWEVTVADGLVAEQAR